ncbi:MAG: M48 family metalloprotease [Asticcacaulis sp.]
MKSISVNETPQHGWGHVVELEDRFVPMVERLEQLAARDIAIYRRRVVAAGLLGYGVLGGLTLSFVALSVLMVVLLQILSSGHWLMLKLLLIFGVLSLSLVRALWVKSEPLDGVAVTAKEAPTLFAVLDRIRSETGGLRLDDVRITNEMNASIIQQTRWAFWGTRNVLNLGLPLLQGMRQTEVEAIIAHEFGHFVGAHGRSTGFVYGIRRRWSQVGERLAGGIVGDQLRKYFNWYGPWFAAYSFVLARRQEYEADQLAATLSGAQVFADALVRIYFQFDRTDAFWPNLWSQSPQQAAPPASPFTLLGQWLVDAEPPEPKALERALAVSADLHDTHPTLSQRLAALNVEPRLPPPLEIPASMTLLAEALDPIRAKFDAHWHAEADENWAENYQERQDALADRQRLEALAATGAATQDDLYQLAEHVELIDGRAAGAAAFAQVLTLYPDAHIARYRYGYALLEQGLDAGIEPLLASARGAPGLKVHALNRIIDFLFETDRSEEAKAYCADLAEAEAEQEKRQTEEGTIDEAVILRPLEPELSARLKHLATDLVGVKRIDAAQRDLIYSNSPQIVLIYTPFLKRVEAEFIDRILEALSPAGDMLAIQNNASRKWLLDRIRKLPNSRIYD